MKKNIFLIIAAMMLVSASVSAKSYKRGVSENSFSLAVEMDVLTPGVSWYYNWSNIPNTGVDNQVLEYEGDFEFVPMAWNANYNADAIREFVGKHPECKYILGYNEPNFTAQANMTPAQAAEKWPELVALANELDLQIIAPALNYSPNPPYQSPTAWFDEFNNLVGSDSYDFVAIHAYGGYGVLTDLATTFHDRYGKPVWVTEFCYWPDTGNTSSLVTPASQISFMISTVEWLETTDWIYRYAWFKAKGACDSATGPNYGLIVPQRGYDPRQLSTQGYIYTYMSDFDKNLWHAVGETFPAVDYVASLNVGLNPGTYSDCAKPIEISQFNAGAYADYQFDVPQSGRYTLRLTVGGYGEPSRFDPQLQVMRLDGEAETPVSEVTKFSLPNDDSTYTTAEIALQLSAGKQTLRLSDKAPYQPSGIRIANIVLTEEGAGVNDILFEQNPVQVDVFTLQGIRVKEKVSPQEATDNLPAGIYLVGDRKVSVK